MKADIARRIENDPNFIELVTGRARFGWTLAIIMLVIYYGFILLVAFDKQLHLLSIDVGGGITLAFPLGLAVILSAIVLTGLYVLRANGRYDQLTRRIVKDAH
jgi:uncharacterized membrane protein (DUF485 family)